jgi:threonyl-tRNA synthetase
VLAIADRHAPAAEETVAKLRAAGVRAEADTRSESVGRKIREAELRKVPYMLVVGDREADEGTVSVRQHGQGDLGSQPVDQFAAHVAELVAARR